MSTTQRFSILTALFTLATLAAPLAAQPAAAADELVKVIDVTVRGNEQMDRRTILAQVRTRVGAPYDEDVANADQRRLMQTGRFDNVVVLKAATDEGMVVAFVVTERKFLAAVVFGGNKHFSDKRLAREITLRAGDPFDTGRLAMARLALEDLYVQEGFIFATVTVDRKLLGQQRAVFTIVEGPRVRVRSIVFKCEGTQSYSTRKLRRQTKTSRAIWLLSRGKLNRRQLARDVDALAAFYRDEGFLDVQVDRELSFNADKTQADVTFLINEGPRYRVGEIRFEGNSVFADAQLHSRLEMTGGRFFTAQAQRRDLVILDNAYGEIGYLETTAKPRTLFMAPDAPAPAGLEPTEGGQDAWLILIYSIGEGEQFRVGRINIRGNAVTKDRVARRQLQFYPGQWFNKVAMQDSERRLRESGLFSTAEITPHGNEPGVRHALVSVTQAQTSQLSFGASYGSNSGASGRISFAQKNFSLTQWPDSWGDLIHGRGFRGDGQTFRILFEPGTEVTRGRVEWREPYLFDRPNSLGAGLHSFSRGRESYDQSSKGGQVTLGRMFKNRWYGEAAVRPTIVKINSIDDDAPTEVLADAGEHATVAFQGMLVRDRTDSRWEPSKGSRTVLKVERFQGDYRFTRISNSYTHYWTVFVDSRDRKHTLAARGEASFIIGDAPVFQRFYGGGYGNIRGFDFRGISPRSNDINSDDPIGGDFLVYAGAEYNFPLVSDTFRAVAFFDSGTVEESVEVTKWRSSVGVGIRLIVPFMGRIPMSLDFGFPISMSDQDDRQTVSFTIGWVY